MHGQQSAADGQQHRPLHQPNRAGRADCSHRKRRRRNGSTAALQTASDTADSALDTANHSINGRTTDGPGRRDASFNRASGDTHCASENIHLGPFTTGRSSYSGNLAAIPRSSSVKPFGLGQQASQTRLKMNASMWRSPARDSYLCQPG
jgi:hypothetical protein